MTPKLSDYSSDFARLVLRCIRREYPNKLDHVLADATQVKGPRMLHPAFYGCFDWHSSVHGHWLLAHLLRLYPELPEATEIRSALNENLTSENLREETAYFNQKDRGSFERMYGWAWLLKLAEELRLSNDEYAQRWSTSLAPLVSGVVEKYLAFLPRQTYPIRTGVHPNTAFGLSFALDYGRTSQHDQLCKLIEERSRAYFLSDADYPAGWEPGGEDFLSPALVEADLMRRVLPAAEFVAWFNRFLPGAGSGEPEKLFAPVTVSDKSDGKLVHLDGLNLSRAWCMQNIASVAGMDELVRTRLQDSALRHAQVGLANVASGHYEGEHWLATFAAYMLSSGFSR
ncbi:MAG: DUF2891 domain-containing protein [Acidobacteriota bacterium]|nr:DUF2891 domain-containing protein [Acidobacteriota bacterium]